MLWLVRGLLTCMPLMHTPQYTIAFTMVVFDKLFHQGQSIASIPCSPSGELLCLSSGVGCPHSCWAVWAGSQAIDMGILHCGSCGGRSAGAGGGAARRRRHMEPAQCPFLRSTGDISTQVVSVAEIHRAKHHQYCCKAFAAAVRLQQKTSSQMCCRHVMSIGLRNDLGISCPRALN